MSSYVPKQVLDVDFEFLDKLYFNDRLPALLELSESNKGSWVDIAKALDSGENQRLVEAMRKAPDNQEAPQESTSNRIDFGNSPDWKNHYWETIVPSFIKNDRRRASDYRIALRLFRRYQEELDEAGFDVYAEGSFTNILKLPRAIETHGNIPEVFSNLVKMTTREFGAYASGVETPREVSKSLKEYLDVLNRRY